VGVNTSRSYHNINNINNNKNTLCSYIISTKQCESNEREREWDGENLVA
jgi:hypothetical protein